MIKTVAGRNYHVMLIGQAISCVPYGVLSNVGGRIAAALLEPDQVSLATGVVGMGLRVGAAIGFLLPPFLFDETEDVDEMGRRLRYWDGSLLAGSVICFTLFSFSTRMTMNVARQVRTDVMQWN